MDLGTEIGPVSGDPEPNFIAAFHDALREDMRQLRRAYEQTRELLMPSIGREWIDACRRGVAKTIQLFIDHGMDVNYQDPRTGQGALHAAAGSSARQSVRVILQSGQCDFLLRDQKGRLASECAYLFGRDAALARLLGNKERKQAAAQGVSIARTP